MKPHDMRPHASPGGMVLIRHLSAGSAGSGSTMQPPSGSFGGCANTMQYDYSGSYSVSLTVGEDSTAVIDGTDITASSSGSNGVFATDSGTALVNDTSIEIMADNSRGLDARPTAARYRRTRSPRTRRATTAPSSPPIEAADRSLSPMRR